jgi:undecaprenyl-diphosphatase
MKRLLIIFPILWVFHVAYASSIDRELYSDIHDGWRSPTMDLVMESMSELGSREVCLSMLLALSTFGGERAKDASKLSLVSLASGQIVCGLLKASVNRERPEGNGSSRWNSSFPSGHAAGAFSLATVLSNKYPHLRLPFYILAGAVSVSRVYLGAHYPSDVVAGAIIGYTSSRITLAHEIRILGFTVSMNLGAW